MEFHLWSFILDNLEAAGVIAGYVSLSIIGFSLISFLVKRRNIRLSNLMGPKWTHPLIGSLFGAIPGCGATIVIASFYKNKKISFGGLLAAFISTLGEGSFVLLGVSSEADVLGNLNVYATITIIGLITGFFLGYIFDLFGFKGNPENQHQEFRENKSSQKEANALAEIIIEKIGVYSILLMAIFLAPSSIMALWGGGIDELSILSYWVSVTLTSTCIVFYFISMFIYSTHDCYACYDNIKSTILHSILDVAMVVTYVFIGLFFANYIIDVIIGEDEFKAWMTSSMYLVVLLSAILGLMPGCGGMIVVAVAYFEIPNFPMAALIAAAISTSGDGIFALFAENKKSGLIVSIVGFLVALLLGYLSLILGF